MIEYENLEKSNHLFHSELKNSAINCVSSGLYILGEQVKEFENEFATYIHAKHVIGVANGLDALTLSLQALELPKLSEVLVASNTYIATILAIIKAGYKPVLVEPEFDTFNIDPDRLLGALTINTKAICVTHLFGKSCRMYEISGFAKEHGLNLIEDCAQSHGAKYNNQMTGTFGDAGCFSFYPTKNLGALGDAGAIVTNRDDLADKLRYLRNYGSGEKYINKYLGFNSRLDEIQASFLRVKLKHLNSINSHKRELAEIYLNNLPDWIRKPILRKEEYDVFHIFGIRYKLRDKLREYLLLNGVKTEIHYPVPPYKQQAMDGFFSGHFPLADELHATELSLPISFGHTTSEVERVCKVIRNFKN